jgi:hypothetical protein
MLAGPLILVLASRTASADCFIHGMRPTDTVALPTTSSGQEFSFIASDDCATLRLSIRGTGLSWRPKGGGPTGPGPSTYRVVLTDEEWDEVVAVSGPTLTWVVTGTTSDGTVTRVSTTNEIQHPTRDLATADATLLGWDDEERPGPPQTGASLANVGDVDGDGQVDVLIGAPNENVVYLSSGPVSGTIDLSESGTRFIGAAVRDLTGSSIAGAGDVNGDGYDDVIIGAPAYGDRFSPTGAAFLVLGPVTGSFDLSLADATFAPAEDDGVGAVGGSVSSAGDMDGDGLPDLLVGAHGTSNADGDAAGAAYVMSGTRRGSQGFESADAWMVGEAGSSLGNSVDGLGDVDGDGLDDFLIAAAAADNNGSLSGAAYVLFGPVDGELDPSDADATLVGESDHDYAGNFTAAAGDVDADGFRDILIGAFRQDDAGDRAGAAYLVRGGVTGTLSLGDADAKLVGEAELDEAGVCVSGAGDVDADGHDDVLVGAWGNDDGGPFAGAAYLMLGPVTGSLDLGRADLTLEGALRDTAGWAVSSAGDLDGDGRADVLVGAPTHGVEGVAAGAAYVLYGGGL